MLNHPLSIPERILAVGPAGSGKTSNFLNIARFAARTQSPARFHIMDTDASLPRMLTGYPEVIPNLTVYPCYEWMDYINAFNTIKATATPIDWVSLDFISSAWADVQTYFTEEVFDNDLGTHLLATRKGLKKDATNLGAFDGWKDWTVINGLYLQFIKPLIFRSHFNLYCTAKSDVLSNPKSPTESKDLRGLWLPYGVKPAGQKDLSFQFHTVLHCSRTAKGDFTISTVKDRERPELSSQPITNFTTDYLVSVAGWGLA